MKYNFFPPIIILIFLASCTMKPKVYDDTRLIMDTLVEVKLSGVPKKIAGRGVEVVFNEFNRVDRLMSRFKPRSAVSGFNNRFEATLKVDPELYNLLKQADEVSRVSGGAFDVTLEPVITLYNFDETKKVIPGRRKLDEALKYVGYQKIRYGADNTLFVAEPKLRIDLGGIAKGYALKRAARLLERAGIGNFLINAGGDIVVRGLKTDGSPWLLGIRNPRGLGIIGKLRVTDTAVVTSGDYERFFFYQGRRYHHILDPKTGRPAPLCRSVTVIYPDPAAADAYATAIFILGPEEGMKLVQSVKGLEALIIAQDGTITKSKGFKYEAQQT